MKVLKKQPLGVAKKCVYFIGGSNQNDDNFYGNGENRDDKHKLKMFERNRQREGTCD